MPLTEAHKSRFSEILHSSRTTRGHGTHSFCRIQCVKFCVTSRFWHKLEVPDLLVTSTICDAFYALTGDRVQRNGRSSFLGGARFAWTRGTWNRHLERDMNGMVSAGGDVNRNEVSIWSKWIIISRTTSPISACHFFYFKFFEKFICSNVLPPTVRTACISQNISKFDPKFAASWQNKWPRAFDIHGVRKFCTQSRSVRFICAAESRASWLAPRSLHTPWNALGTPAFCMQSAPKSMHDPSIFAFLAAAS